ncbi:MAG: hypothetical protein Q8S43_01700 [Actinomycetota bacterium]|nr:hypothetical protein [Actinomycetota bacterium]MDP3629655.1 hypothetical protein [Actinomycetota bacterium]MDZ4234170.1 hypothetical protein [Dietzia sp.]
MGYALDMAGVTCDLLFMATGAQTGGIGAAIFGGLGSTIGVLQLIRTGARFADGRATGGDLALAIVGVVPLVGMVKAMKPVATTAKVVDGLYFTQDSVEFFF